MDIHNVMEELVESTVDELFDMEPNEITKTYCRCRYCRMDVACYALNRIKPEYVMSGRGLSYSNLDYNASTQKKADVVSVVKEGWNRINATPRPSHGPEQTPTLPTGPVFNIRPIIGRIFNGITFEPLSDIEISLFYEDELVKMIDSNWQNPYPLHKSTSGNFSFWIYPFISDSRGERKKFTFRLEVKANGFETLNHFIEMDVISEKVAETHFSIQNVHHLQDLYLFPK